MIICKDCQEPKPEADYYCYHHNKDKRRIVCKSCILKRRERLKIEKREFENRKFYNYED